MKKCPFCAEEIQDGAIKCRFCGECLKKKWWKNCFFGCFITFIASIVLTILFIFIGLMMLKLVYYKIFFVRPRLHDYYPPFTGQGIEGIVRDFAQTFQALWERLRDFFQIGPQHYNKITF